MRIPGGPRPRSCVPIPRGESNAAEFTGLESFVGDEPVSDLRLGNDVAGVRWQEVVLPSSSFNAILVWRQTWDCPGSDSMARPHIGALAFAAKWKETDEK